MSNDKKIGKFVKVGVVLLALFVFTQSIVLYFLVLVPIMNRNRVEVRQDDQTLKSRIENYDASSNLRTPQLLPQNVMGNKQLMRPPQLSKLNLDLTKMSGIKAKTQQPHSTIASNVVRSPSGITNSVSNPIRGLRQSPQSNMQDEFSRMRQMMDEMMGSMGRRGGVTRMGSFPTRGNSRSSMKHTLSQNSDNYIVKLKIAGLDTAELKASIDNNIITLFGVQKEESRQSSQYGSSYSSSSSSFQNSFSLPGPIKRDGVKVQYENDLLTLTIPKA